MAAEVESEVPIVEAEPAPPAQAPAEDGMPVAEEKSEPVKEKKPRAPKAPKEKKPRTAKPASVSHPPYFQMIKEAILAQKDKGGSSLYAIAKHMEEKYKAVLPANFRKRLLLQLKNGVAKGRLVKVKGSFKLPESGKRDAPAKKPPVKEKKTKTAGAEKIKAAGAAAPKGEVDAEKKKRKRRSVASKSKAAPARAKAGKSAKAGVKKAKKMTPAKPRQPKSIKSPVAKRARKAAKA